MKNNKNIIKLVYHCIGSPAPFGMEPLTPDPEALTTHHARQYKEDAST